MHAHIVVAHPEPKSYNAHLAAVARRTLEAQGATVSISDLYQMDFDPCERASHYAQPLDRERFDRVFIYGDVYTSKQRFEHGRFVGRKAMLSVTVGTSADTYHYNGRSGDIELLLWPINFSLAYAGYDVLQPHVAYGVEAGARYSDAATIDARLQRIAADWASNLEQIADRPTVPFNKMAHWGADGHITPDAPAHSAFMRQNQHLTLE